MCLIHIDEPAIHVSTTAWPSHLCVPFSKKLDSLLDHLDNQGLMYGFQCDARESTHGDRNDAHYYSTVTSHGYIYLLCLVLITNSHSFAFCLGFSSLLFLLATMEEKRGTKRSRSPSKEGSSSLSGGLTPPLAPPGSPSPPGSLSEVSLCHPCSPVLEQGAPSEKIPVMDLSSSSDEENPIPDISWDEEFTKRLLGDLNHGLLKPPGDGKVIILSGSDEEEKVSKEDVATAEAMPSSTVKSLASTTSATDTDTNDVDKGRSPD
jgi:hypothetical protein